MRIERIGDATLYLGDCLQILPTLGPVDACITDPPYGIGYCHNGGVVKGIGGGAYATKFHGRPVIGDKQKFDPGPLLSIAKECIFFGANNFADRLPASSCWLVWDKRAASGHTNDFADCEMAWTSLPKVARMFRHHWDGMMKASERGVPRVHPTQKPVAVMEWCLGFVPTAETILDPYMGSGTTGAACINLGRKFIGIEIDETYFDIACRRIEQAVRKADSRLPGFVPRPKPQQMGILP